MLRSPPDEVTPKAQRPLAAAVVGGEHALCCQRWNIWQGYRLPYSVPRRSRDERMATSAPTGSDKAAVPATRSGRDRQTVCRPIWGYANPAMRASGQ